MNRSFWASRSSEVLAGGLLALAVAAAYAGSLSCPFVFDDVGSITENPTIRRLWPPWTPLSPPGGGLTVTGRPLVNFSLAVNYALGGTNVRGYHVVNVAIHLAAALALFGIVRRTLARSQPGAEDTNQNGRATGMALAVALIWAVHPLQTEAVTYVIQRAESLMGLLYLLTLYFVIRGIECEGRARFLWHALAIAACFAGMATKEVMVSAPLMALLYDRTFAAGSFREAWRLRRRLYTGLASSWLLLGWLVILAHGRGNTSGFGVAISPWAYWATQFPAVTRYLRLSVWPHPLVFDYGYDVRSSPNPLAIALHALAVAALIGGAIIALRRRSALGFWGIGFFATLAPTSVMPGARQFMAEHRMYLALVPVIVLIVVGAERLLRRFGPAVSVAVLLFFAGCLGAATARRNHVYRSEMDLWSDTAAKAPRSVYALDGLGTSLYRAGRPNEAEAKFREALQLEPNYAQAHFNLGNVLANTRRLPEAIAQYEWALRLHPDFAEAHLNLGNALLDSGSYSPALLHFEEAARLRPDDARVYINFGAALRAAGRLPEAVVALERALRLDPNNAEAHNNLGVALALTGRIPEAIAEFELALRLNPSYAEARRNLEVVREGR